MTKRRLHPQSNAGLIANHQQNWKRSSGADRSPEHWLLQRDITLHDLPYTHSLLQTAYIQWLLEIPPSIRKHLNCVLMYDYKGECLEGSDKLNELEAGIPLQELVQRVLSKRKPAWDEEAVYAEKAAAFPIVSRYTKELIGIVLFVCDESDMLQSFALQGWVYALRTHFYREFEHLFVEEMYHTHRMSEREAERREVLYYVMRHIHDRIDVDSVLTQIIDGIQRLVPDTIVEVYLSQDHRSENPNVKALVFKSWGDPIVMEAFMKGETCTANSDSGFEVAFALNGKQGSYGVLKLIFAQEQPETSDLQVIELIIEAAGTAFENARLHEHANNVIQELRLINELTKRINQSLRLRDVFDDAMHELLRVFHADFCMLLQLNEDKSLFEVVSSNIAEYVGSSYSTQKGLFGYVLTLREPVIISDSEDHHIERIQMVEDLGLRSIIAAPLFSGGELVGIVAVADKRPHFFTYDNFKLLQMLSAHLGLAIANATLHDRVKHLANKDQLTGLYARHYLDKQVNRQQQKDFCGSLIVVDIDYFKQVNDTFGHQIGDKILVQVSDIIRSSIRETDIASRWGGEEIAVYLPQLNTTQTKKVAERIRNRVEQETDPKVTVSCGVAEWSWQDEKVSVETLFYRADMALYEAKKKGRNVIQIASGEEHV
ncbi:sensor domain-containing diguanylate cyclase [Paenibacillus sp. SC116]|uniref:sensor domain-containing diguanylate cyclase n=1 Tax=Paenibacillus sp. SC116 TaxID=2968986 RepID=UPI00215A1B0D|nr:sensor domain-containing diguanylate cyclase [Paenibacillus sp. SC116]MCR8845664.1 sensor domain-containing diguanylate cyclase [Paenibacillus sp. SC116]